MNRRNLFFGVATVLGLVADQATKWWVVQNIDYSRGEIKVIPGLLSIVHAQNPGAAMGFLGSFEYRYVVFLAFTAVAVVVIFDMLRKLATTDRVVSLALGLILSGALGNGIDRVRQRYVTDFIRVYTDNPSIKPWLIANLGTNEYPSFNVADAALVIGVALYLLHYLFEKEPPQPASSAPPAG